MECLSPEFYQNLSYGLFVFMAACGIALVRLASRGSNNED